jgi:phosphopantetheinyl transferase
MSKGEELHTLRQSPEHAIELWVCKEAVQKTLGMGMHLNPREIVIPIGVTNTIISIEKSKIQLVNWQYQGTCIAVAFHQGTLDVTTPEDRLLEATRSAMQDGDWGVGCKTTSGRV